jgi:hypothetical protein
LLALPKDNGILQAIAQTLCTFVALLEVVIEATQGVAGLLQAPRPRLDGARLRMGGRGSEEKANSDQTMTHAVLPWFKSDETNTAIPALFLRLEISYR